MCADGDGDAAPSRAASHARALSHTQKCGAPVAGALQPGSARICRPLPAQGESWPACCVSAVISEICGLL